MVLRHTPSDVSREELENLRLIALIRRFNLPQYPIFPSLSLSRTAILPTIREAPLVVPGRYPGLIRCASVLPGLYE